MKLLHDPRDLFNALQVSRTWCLTAYPLLWCRPSLTHPLQLASLSRTLVSPSPSLPYATSIRRLNLSMVSTRLNDYLIDGLEYCTRVDRLTITNAEGLSTQALKRVLGGMRDTTAVDLSGTACVENSIVRRIGEGMDRLQGLNITGCKGVGDEGLKVIAERRKNFRRVCSIVAYRGGEGRFELTSS
jgi:F-box and leucine-rich repeat protein GRR1